MLDNSLFASHDSTTYGLNYASPLNSINFYHVSSGQLPQDVMHTLLEGVLPKEIQLMLEEFVYVQKLLTLNTLNDRVAYFNYGRSENKSKPPKGFEVNHIRGTTKLPLSGNY